MEPVLMGNEILTIDADTRTIEVPSDFLLGVETDNDAERVEFQCPKVVGDNLDLTQYHIYIHYQNAKGEKGKYLCEDIEDGGENITFSWLLSQKVTLYKGQTKFLVCAKKTQEDTIVWNTTLASGNVLEGLDVDEDIVQQNDDVIEQILLRLERIEDSGGTGDINNAKVTFTEAEERTNIESQETMSTIYGKIKKWFSDLKTVAFTGSYNDLSNKPDIPEEYTLPQANENQLGGIKAKAKTTETVEVAIGEDGKLYANSVSQEQINEAIKNAIVEGSTTGDVELHDIRKGYDGTNYDTAGEAVRGQVAELKNELTQIESDLYTDFSLIYNIGAYTVNGDYALNNPQLIDWENVVLDVSSMPKKTLTVVTYADNKRPIIFTDDNLFIIDTIVHNTGNPNLRWEVEVVVPTGATKMYINHYASIEEDVSVYGYNVLKLPKVLQESGTSEVDVMSQKAVTEYVDSKLPTINIMDVSLTNNRIPIIDEDVPCYLDNLFIGISPKECKLVATQNAYIQLYDKKIALITTGHGRGGGQIRLYLNDDKKYEVYASLPYDAASKHTGTKKVIFIGDSMTENLSYINPLKKISDEGDYKIEFLGTLGDDGYKNEGRGGWAAYNYATNDLSGMTTSKTNAFWDGSSFNFNYYMTNNNIDVPDYIFINLGTNDMLRGVDTSDENNIKSVITESYQTMIDSIRAYSDTIPIILWLPPTRSLAGRNNHLAIDSCLRANKWLIDKFDTKTYINNRVYLMPTYLFVNPYTDYNMITTTIDGIEYEDNAEPIHPSENGGGEKIAKGIIRQMMYIDGLLN